MRLSVTFFSSPGPLTATAPAYILNRFRAESIQKNRFCVRGREARDAGPHSAGHTGDGRGPLCVPAGSCAGSLAVVAGTASQPVRTALLSARGPGGRPRQLARRLHAGRAEAHAG